MNLQFSNIPYLKAWLVSGLFVLSLFSFVSEGFAQSARDINNRLSRLENELETLNRAVYRGESPAPASGGFAGDPASQAATEVRLQQLEIQIRELTGKVEEQSFQVRQLTEQLERMKGDVELRLSELEGGAPASTNAQPNSSRYTTSGLKYQDRSSQVQNSGSGYQWQSNTTQQLGTLTEPASGSASVAASNVAGGAAAAYENAFALVKAGQYDRAEKEFAGFLQAHPGHALAGNAKYWLGETYYVRNDFETAARVFAEGYQEYPDNTKAPDNLLKLGMSLAALGNNGDACIALGQLETQYPSGAGPVLIRARQEMQRLGC